MTDEKTQLPATLGDVHTHYSQNPPFQAVAPLSVTKQVDMSEEMPPTPKRFYLTNKQVKAEQGEGGIQILSELSYEYTPKKRQTQEVVERRSPERIAQDKKAEELYYAAKQGNLEKVRELVEEQGVKVNYGVNVSKTRTPKWVRPLVGAALCRKDTQKEIIMYLLRNGATPRFHSVIFGYPARFVEIGQASSSVQEHFAIAIFNAAREGNLERVRELVKEIRDIFKGSMVEQERFIKATINYKFKLEDFGDTEICPLEGAKRGGKDEGNHILYYLVSQGAKPLPLAAEVQVQSPHISNSNENHLQEEKKEEPTQKENGEDELPQKQNSEQLESAAKNNNEENITGEKEQGQQTGGDDDENQKQVVPESSAGKEVSITPTPFENESQKDHIIGENIAQKNGTSPRKEKGSEEKILPGILSHLYRFGYSTRSQSLPSKSSILDPDNNMFVITPRLERSIKEESEPKGEPEDILSKHKMIAKSASFPVLLPIIAFGIMSIVEWNKTEAFLAQECAVSSVDIDASLGLVLCGGAVTVSFFSMFSYSIYNMCRETSKQSNDRMETSMSSPATPTI